MDFDTSSLFSGERKIIIIINARVYFFSLHTMCRGKRVGWRRDCINLPIEISRAKNDSNLVAIFCLLTKDGD